MCKLGKNILLVQLMILLSLILPIVLLVLLYIQSFFLIVTISVFRKASQWKSVAVIPFVLALLKQLGWFVYGLLIENVFIMIAGFNSLVHLYGLMTALRLSTQSQDSNSNRNKSILEGTTLFGILFWLLAATCLTTSNLDSTLQTEIWGILCSIVDTIYQISFCEVIPKVIRTKDSSSIYFPGLVINLISCILWIIYSISIRDIPLFLCSLLGFGINTLLITLSHVYKKNENEINKTELKLVIDNNGEYDLALVTNINNSINTITTINNNNNISNSTSIPNHHISPQDLREIRPLTLKISQPSDGNISPINHTQLEYNQLNDDDDELGMELIAENIGLEIIVNRLRSLTNASSIPIIDTNSDTKDLEDLQDLEISMNSVNSINSINLVNGINMDEVNNNNDIITKNNGSPDVVDIVESSSRIELVHDIITGESDGWNEGLRKRGGELHRSVSNTSDSIFIAERERSTSNVPAFEINPPVPSDEVESTPIIPILPSPLIFVDSTTTTTTMTTAPSTTIPVIHNKEQEIDLFKNENIEPIVEVTEILQTTEL